MQRVIAHVDKNLFCSSLVAAAFEGCMSAVGLSTAELSEQNWLTPVPVCEFLEAEICI